eukprot:4228181-Alexandrium_andersonii.AAC.1
MLPRSGKRGAASAQALVCSTREDNSTGSERPFASFVNASIARARAVGLPKPWSALRSALRQ